MLSPILQPSTGMWLLGKIENHTAKPMSRAEIEAHIADYNRLQQLCSEQSSALKWAKELLEQKGLANASDHPTASGKRG